MAASTVEFVFKLIKMCAGKNFVILEKVGNKIRIFKIKYP